MCIYLATAKFIHRSKQQKVFYHDVISELADPEDFPLRSRHTGDLQEPGLTLLLHHTNSNPSARIQYNAAPTAGSGTDCKGELSRGVCSPLAAVAAAAQHLFKVLAPLWRVRHPACVEQRIQKRWKKIFYLSLWYTSPHQRIAVSDDFAIAWFGYIYKREETQSGERERERDIPGSDNLQWYRWVP